MNPKSFHISTYWNYSGVEEAKKMNFVLQFAVLFAVSLCVCVSKGKKTDIIISEYLWNTWISLVKRGKSSIYTMDNEYIFLFDEKSAHCLNSKDPESKSFKMKITSSRENETEKYEPKEKLKQEDWTRLFMSERNKRNWNALFHVKRNAKESWIFFSMVKKEFEITKRLLNLFSQNRDKRQKITYLFSKFVELKNLLWDVSSLT